MNKPRIAVIMGGKSVEHEISIISALQAYHAIDKNKYDVFPIYISKEGEFYHGEKLPGGKSAQPPLEGSSRPSRGPRNNEPHVR